jgi:hypothetical protein
MRLYLHGADVNGAVTYFDACEVRRTNGFLGDKGTVIVPAQVANVGVWTDGSDRYMARFSVGGTEDIRVHKAAANNTMTFRYEAGSVVETQVTGGLANVDFATYGITWDISAGATGEVRYYIRGAAVGATDTGLGTWAGDLNPIVAVIGATNTTPGSVWSGSIGPVPIWSEALSPDEMRYLGT